MDMTESLRERMSARKDAPAWVARAGMVAALAGVLTACGGQPAAEPTAAPAATTAPAEEATAPAEETAEPAAEATAAGEEAASPAAMASPVAAGMATPIAAGMATPVAGAATPVAGMATPVGDAIAYTPQICDSVNGWLARPEVAPVLQQPVWYQILEEGRKDAAGEPVDVALMQADFATLDGAATAMRGVASDDVKHGPVAIATQMIGRSARLAGGLADGTETQAQAQAAVTELQGLISAYEADSAARLAACGA
ncbi:MAG: hypothetical protein R2853_16195 [Thermomicrobiales bacterium]|nr:hypothetical protein [Thermomicrobiales bacterium]